MLFSIFLKKISIHLGRMKSEIIDKTKPYSKEIKWKSWYYTLSTLLLLIGSLSCTVLVHNYVLKIALGVLSGLLNIRMFVIYHDYVHNALLYKSKAAEKLFFVYGLYMLAPNGIWKKSHTYHHSYNSHLAKNDIGAFVTLPLNEYNALSPGEKRRYLLIRHPLTILLGYLSMFLINFCVIPFVTGPKKYVDSLVALVLHVAIGITIFIELGWLNYVCVWFLPFFVSHCIGTYLFYAQHNFPGAKLYKENWSYEQAALYSSSYMPMNRVMQWFTANIGFHHIHHINSTIPFYRLPEVMKDIKGLQNPGVTSLKFKDIRNCLRLKVYCTETDRLVPLR